MLLLGLPPTRKLCSNTLIPYFSGTKDTMQFWNELEGQKIDGVYPLHRLVRSEGRSAWFETEADEPQRGPATISITEALTDADEVVARLKAAQSLKHPNLVSITRVGQASLDDTIFVYAVMEHIEQSLSDVLQSQALSPEEAREVAEAMVGALTVVHQQGMSHGHVEAASVLATTETVKLRSDCLQANPAGQTADVAGVGATLFHAFTQRKGLSATDAQINRIPAPFAEIIRNSFARLWTLAQIGNALKPVPVVSSVPPVPPPAPVQAPPIAVETTETKVPETAASETTALEAGIAEPNVRGRVAQHRPARVIEGTAVAVAKPRPLELEEEESLAKRIPMALYVALAVAALVLIGWLVFRPRSATPPESAAAPVSTQAAAPEVAAAPVEKPSAAKPSPAVSTRELKAGAAPVSSPQAATTTSSDGRSVWHVIAYTYKGQPQATEMADRISGKHPNLKVSVFSPPGRSVYLVILGGDMDRDEAAKMVDKARSMGMPGDTYMQNFSR